VATGEYLCDFFQSDSRNRPFRVRFSDNGEHLAVRFEEGQIYLFNTSNSLGVATSPQPFAKSQDSNDPGQEP
jgi:hypothetical protein